MFIFYQTLRSICLKDLTCSVLCFITGPEYYPVMLFVFSNIIVSLLVQFMLDLEEFEFYNAKPSIIRNNVQMPQKPIVRHEELITFTVHSLSWNIPKPKNDRTFTLAWWVSCGTSGLFLATSREIKYCVGLICRVQL